MRKNILFFVLVIVALCVFTACADKPVETVTPDNLDEGYDTRFDNTVEDAAACYFSLLTEDGFGNYILAFPETFIKGYQRELEYDDATFEEAINNATYTLHVNRDIKYDGAEYHIEYSLEGEREIEGTERDNIVNDLAKYCYMPSGNIEKVVEYSYLVHTYGVVQDSGDIVVEEDYTENITMLYIAGEGWYVSPTEFQLP
ncbi:MAG: hypothetical protein IKL05_00650 [Clostridia bacterium]|nr:hypothetical protein [Clostridia bacterium]